MRTVGLLLWAIAVLALSVGMTQAGVQYVDSPPLAEVVKAQVRDVKQQAQTVVPLITWGGDIATILANGNSEITKKQSIFGKSGLIGRSIFCGVFAVMRTMQFGVVSDNCKSW